MDDLFREGIEFFNQGYYFEAHDTFEEIWMDERGPSRKFYQGLVQLSTGFYHLSMKNLKGGISQLHKGLDKLEPFQPEYRGLKLDGPLATVRKCILESQKKSPEAFSFNDLKYYIPTLKINHKGKEGLNG